eukprot:1389716-Prorocentrum_lima.AAC.1
MSFIAPLFVNITRTCWLSSGDNVDCVRIELSDLPHSGGPFYQWWSLSHPMMSIHVQTVTI